MNKLILVFFVLLIGCSKKTTNTHAEVAKCKRFFWYSISQDNVLSSLNTNRTYSFINRMQYTQLSETANIPNGFKDNVLLYCDTLTVNSFKGITFKKEQ